MPLTNPQLTILQPHNQDTVNLNQPFPVTGQVVNPFVAGEPVLIDSVTVRVDGGPVIEATLTPVTDKSQTKVNFAASAEVTAGEDPHAVTVTATNDQGVSATKTVSVLTEPVVVVPPAYTVQHIYVDRTDRGTVTATNETKLAKYSFSSGVQIRHPGTLHTFLNAEYFIHLKADPKHPQKKILPLTFKIYSPDGLEFTAPNVTLDDLARFRDLRSASEGSWRFEVNGMSDPIFIDDKDGSVTAPQATVRFSLEEPVPSQSAGPLVNGPITKIGAQVFSFDLFRVGQFTANIQSKSGVTPWEGTLRLKAPDGTVAASSPNNRLAFPVTLQTIDQSRDAAGQVRQWSLEVDTTSPLGLGSAVRATVTGTTRIPVIVFQGRIDYLIGFNGSKICIFFENSAGRLLGRFKVTDIYSAETINILHLLDDVIKKVHQDPGVDQHDVDIEPNIAYNFLNLSDTLHVVDVDLTFDVSSLKVNAIKIRAGASQHIQPQVPAVAVELDFEGKLNVNLDGFNLGSATINNNRLTLEVGATLDASGAVATVSWVNDDPFNVDLSWEAALLAGILTSGLLNLGSDGLAEYILEHFLNDFLVDSFKSIVEAAIFQTPRIMSDVLGAALTLTSFRMDNDTNEIVIDYVAPIEPDPKPNPFYTGVIGRSVTRLGPGSWQIVPPSLGDTWAASNLINKIDHIFVVMMENRAFDHVLGYRAALPNAQGEDGLSTELCDFLKTKGFIVRPLSESGILPNGAHLKTRFPVGVGHALADVVQQLSEKLQTPNGRSINSPKGFVDDFESRVGSGLVDQDVLGYYTDSDLAMYRFLAENYSYCDRYFSSHPGPTLPNRMFSLGGDVQYDRVGEAILDNNNADNFRVSRAPNIFDVLTRKNISWRVYESFPSITMLRFFARYAADNTDIVGIGLNQLERDIAFGDVKSVTFIDPAMHSAPENDDHPPFADMLSGQIFIKRIYDALRSNEALWLKTLLIITYDEHGGFYDHVIPPVADALSMPGGTGFKKDMTIPYGLRVPAFVVSPWVPAGKGPDLTLDHCSIVKTILARFCGTEKPFLSDRVRASLTFDSFLTESTPRLNVPPSPGFPDVFAPLRPPGASAIITPPVSGKAFARGEVESPDLMGMLARLLGRRKFPPSPSDRTEGGPVSSLAPPLTGFQGQIAATGDNSDGQLGDGTTKARLTPILVSALGETVTQVAAGAAFGVALKADGTVWTWGRNAQGQLGDGTLSNKLVPQQVPNLPAITQISAGIGHVLALASDGTVLAWGANDKGQVGVEWSHAVTSPTKVSGLNGITQVSAGNEFSVAVGPNGTVQGWGDNHFGQLGSGEEFESAYWLVPARDLTNVIQVAAGADHTVALRGDRTVWIWGANLHRIELLPRQVLELPPGILQVAAGGNDSFAVSADQTAGSSLWAWGLNVEGRLGDQTTTARARPVEIPLPDVYQIVATDGSTAAIRTKNGGTLWAWGENHAGELGIDSTQLFVTEPTEAVGLTNVTFVSMGHEFSLAIGTAHPRVAVSDRTDQAAKFVSVSLSADGGAAPYTWDARNLPPGLSIDSSSGVISGTPTHPSKYTITATATDQAGHAGSASFLWTFKPQIVTVPNVLGLQKEDAIAAMESVGLVLGGISLDNGCIDVGGTVLIQYPSAGPFALVPGASYRLTVSSGHDSRGKPCTFE